MGHFGLSSCQGESDEGNDAPDNPGDGPLRPRVDAGAVVAGEEAQCAARCDESAPSRSSGISVDEGVLVRLLGAVHVRGQKKALFALNPIVKMVDMFKEVGNETIQSHSKLLCRLTTRGLQ